MMADPPLRCYGTLVEFGRGDAICDLDVHCAAFEYRDDYPAYRAAHHNIISSDVAMDPDGEF